MDLLIIIFCIVSIGFCVQGEWMWVVFENVVNVNLIVNEVGGDFYWCKIIVFNEFVDVEFGSFLVEIIEVECDMLVFIVCYEFQYFVVDVNGYVKLFNVNLLIEMVNMCEVLCFYEVNFMMLEQVWFMCLQLIDLLE